ncbi:glycosyltransferase family 1 protein [Pararhodobacter sp. SW119]|uniref:glycosyltransferase family 4 protein n=1 Tax=Pararhodobacter sp. SW119 TaxID=2780075 RepID=UPI001ADF26CC|nr:glycosyltransferase family 1 protein [Pararhodobacter sp. SW119]
MTPEPAGLPALPDAQATPPRASDPTATPLPRRLLIVSDAWHPQVNGVVRTYENIARVLAAEGCAVRVIGPDAFRRVALPFYPEIPLAIAPYRRLARMIEDFAPEAIHIAVEGPLGWAARRWCLATGTPFSTAFHTNFPAYAALRVPRPVRAAVTAQTIAALRRFHAPAQLIHVAAPSVAEMLRDWGFRNRLVRLSRGVDLSLFHPGPDRPPAARPVLLYVGRVAPEKNIEEFLELPVAARKVVVGDGPLRATLARRHPAVDFRGTLTGPALAEAYRAADVFVFPSRTETFGIVLIEALASGLPVAAHDAPGPRDILGGQPGLGVIDADLGRAVARALIAPGTPAQRHAHVRAQYSWDEVARAFRAHAAEMTR